MSNAIICDGVGKRYGEFSLNEIDLIVPTGTVMGFVGPNGAGKSTTLRIIMGLVAADRGAVKVLGRRMPEDQVEAKREIGFVSEDMRLHALETVGYHMDMMAAIYPGWDQAYADTLVKRFGLDPSRKVKGLSHGQRVKACLLMALARRPRLLVLDEPTTGLDPLARRQLLSEMADVLADEDRSIIFSSHNTIDVEHISDHVTFISEGSIVFSRERETLMEEWRRLRLQVPDDFSAPDLPGVVEVRRSGRLATITTSAYDRSVHAAWENAGAEIKAVERLTLEEIFFTAVADASEVSS
jgi:ABC-2 type transport system ATP-binding protein